MGATRTALEAGSIEYRYVVAIEGISILLTNATPAQALAAWTGLDWSSAEDGLSVDLSIETSMEPDSPTGGMGSCNLWILNETVNALIAKRAGGTETYLNASMSRTTSTVTVKSAAAYATSGEIHIGTECIAHTGTTTATFTGLTRGKYSPFGTNSSTRFTHDHRVELDSNSVNSPTVVSTIPRIWKGRLVGVWLHRMVGGVLDTKTEAELVFAGRVREIRDDQNTGATVIALKPEIDDVLDRVIGANPYTATIKPEFYLAAGSVFQFQDATSASIASGTLQTLTVVAASPGANEIIAGAYSHSTLCNALSVWLAAAAGLKGTYSIASPVTTTSPQGICTKMYWTNTGVSVIWKLVVPFEVALFLGIDVKDQTAGQVNWFYNDIGKSNAITEAPNTVGGAVVPLSGGNASRVSVTTTSGTFINEYARLPYAIRPDDNLGLEWSLFMIGDSRLVLAAKSGNDLLYIRPWLGMTSIGWLSAAQSLAGGRLADEASGSIVLPYNGTASVRQVFAWEYERATMLIYLFGSTGTAGYNQAFLDALPDGAGVPWKLIGDDFVSEIEGGGESIGVFIDKPKKLRELLEGDLAFCWAYLTWRNGTLRFRSWRIPSSAQATYTLDESNKAEPAGHKANQRSSTTETDSWRKEAVEIRYNRAVGSTGVDDEYLNTVTFIDGPAIDDAGGATKVHTISLSNTFSSFAATGAGVETLLPKYLAKMPLITRNGFLVERGINPLYFWRIGLGDTVLMDDLFVRDPATGTRGISGRPCLVVRHGFKLGGKLPGDPPDAKAAPMGGRVTLFFTEQDTERTGATYVPCADVNETSSAYGSVNGYNDSTKTLVTYAHRYSESTEISDNARLVAGAKVLIIERDPVDPAAPLMWDRVVDSTVLTDRVVLTVALSSPAWDSTKRYRIVSQPYTAATTTQRTQVYAADDADGRILDIAQPYLYGSATPDPTYTANTSTEIELVPTVSYGDGSGRDAGHETALIRQLDNFLDYKSAIQCPMLSSTVVSNTTVTGADYLLVAYFPIFLGYDILGSGATRLVSVAPWAYSTDGTSTKLRISLCRDRPSGSSLTNMYLGAILSRAEWTGITSATPGALSAKSLVAQVKHPFTGQAYVVIELGYKCATRGLARFVEGARLPA
jgi:hypothetical protein